MSPFRGVARLLLQRAAAVQAAQPSGNVTSALTGGAQQNMASQLQASASANFAHGAAGASPWSWQHNASRSITTSVPARSDALLPLLDAEVKHEQDNYEKPEAVAGGTPAPFTLTEANGDTMLTLTRKYNNEDISVDLHVNNQPAAPEGSEDDEGELSTVIFNVHVVKGKESLVFECESDGTFVAINHLSHETEDTPVTDSTYTGPVFDELDDQLQEELRNYLGVRGITAELGEYLRHLVYDKEVREYQEWLRRVASFLRK